MIKVAKKDLFELENTHHLALCVSRDFKMGVGIAAEFDRRYGLRNILINYAEDERVRVGDTIKFGKFLILVTKEEFNDKPTYDNMERCLLSMQMKILRHHIKKVGMYRLGCHLDQLDWSVVRYMIENTIGKLDIEIEVRDFGK